MAKILVLYSTTDGHTLKICQRLHASMENLGDQVMVHPIAEGTTMDLGAFEKIVIGASIRYGKHSPEVYEFIKTHTQSLESRPSAFFTVNVTARKPDKNQPDTNPYLVKFLTQISWKPQQLAVIAGKIEYQKYRLFDRVMIRFIMWLTKGPTDPDTNIEFTDWDKVDEFAQTISAMQ